MNDVILLLSVPMVMEMLMESVFGRKTKRV
jgi:hypothetical protein